MATKDIQGGATTELAVNAATSVAELKYPNPGLEALAKYAAQQLINSDEHKEKKDWFDRCLQIASKAEKGAPSRTTSRRRELLGEPIRK